MKNIIKKIAATAMAFTLLGAGTAVTKTIAPQFDNSITASAACSHTVGAGSAGEWKKYDTTHKGWLWGNWQWWYKQPVKCTKCGKVLWTNHKKEYWTTTTIYTEAGSYDVSDCYDVEYWTEY